jgi:hypothetical protein
VATRAGAILRPAPRLSYRWLVVPQIAGMFVLTNVGWLLFRETNLRAIVRGLTLSPFGSPALDGQAAAYLFRLALVYSLPSYPESLGGVAQRLERGSRRRLSSARGRASLCSMASAAAWPLPPSSSCAAAPRSTSSTFSSNLGFLGLDRSVRKTPILPANTPES